MGRPLLDVFIARLVMRVRLRHRIFGCSRQRGWGREAFSLHRERVSFLFTWAAVGSHKEKTAGPLPMGKKTQGRRTYTFRFRFCVAINRGLSCPHPHYVPPTGCLLSHLYLGFTVAHIHTVLKLFNDYNYSYLLIGCSWLLFEWTELVVMICPKPHGLV